MDTKKKTKKSSADKKIIEIFYDSEGREIRPTDTDYEKYLNGEDYFGSYFIDSDGNVVKSFNQKRKEELEKRDLERKKLKEEEIKKEKEKFTPKKALLLFLALAILFIIFFTWDTVIVPLIIGALFILAIIGSMGIRR